MSTLVSWRGHFSLGAFCAPLVLVCGLASPAAADVLTVGLSGDYPDIQSAILVAQDGDTLLIDGGTYGPVILGGNLSISLVAEVDATVLIDGGVIIQGLSASRTVTLAGLTTEGDADTLRPALWIQDNEGSVRIESVTLQGGNTIFFGIQSTPGGRVENSDDVAFVDCILTGGSDELDFINPGDGVPGLLVDDSTVSLWGGVVTGGVAGNSILIGEPGFVGGPGLRAGNGSFIHTSGTQFVGGRGGVGGSCESGVPSGPSADGGPGVSVQGFGSHFRNQDITAAGGAGGAPSPDSLFCQGTGIGGATGAPLDVATANVTNLGGSAHAMQATSPLREFATFHLNLVGEPGELVAILASAGTDTLFEAGARGQFLLAAPFQVRLVGTLPGSGELDLLTAFPDLGPGVENVVLYTQPLFLAPGGELSLGAPFTAVVLDSAF